MNEPLSIDLPERGAGKKKPPRRVFFLHIPKCAGSTIWLALHDLHGGENTFQVRTPADLLAFEAMPVERRRSFLVIGGHGHFHKYKELIGDMRGYFAFVTFREPVARIVSNFNYIGTNESHRNHNLVKGISLDQFVDEYANHNAQTKSLCGEEPDIGRAIKVLDRNFDYWCLTHETSDLIARFYKRTDRQPLSMHDNRSESGLRVEEISPKLLAHIRALNAVDMGFYERIVSRRRTGLGWLMRQLRRSRA